MSIEDRFDLADGEYLKFDRVANKLSQRPDLHAFIWLDRRFPGQTHDMISGAEHDEFYLNIAGEQIEQLTADEIVDLHRCGVRYDSDYDCLCMFA